jgi:hypothetical protein
MSTDRQCHSKAAVFLRHLLVACGLLAAMLPRLAGGWTASAQPADTGATPGQAAAEETKPAEKKKPVDKVDIEPPPKECPTVSQRVAKAICDSQCQYVRACPGKPKLPSGCSPYPC